MGRLDNIKTPTVEEKTKLAYLVGKRFHRLVLVELLGFKVYTSKRSGHRNKEPVWKAICDCGNNTSIHQCSVMFGGTKSCGCLRVECRHLRSDENSASSVWALRGLLSQYKSCAKKRGYAFELSEADFKNITSGDCHYCGVPPLQIRKSKNSVYTYNGVDRVDNNTGYTLSNSISCCVICNRMKNKLTIADFKTKIKSIYKKLRLQDE